MAKFNLFFTIVSKSLSLNLIIGHRTSYYISKFAENCAADKVSIVGHLSITSSLV